MEIEYEVIFMIDQSIRDLHKFISSFRFTLSIAFYLYCFFKTTFLHFTNILMVINLLKGQQSHIIAKQTCIIVHSVGTY